MAMSVVSKILLTIFALFLILSIFFSNGGLLLNLYKIMNGVYKIPEQKYHPEILHPNVDSFDPFFKNMENIIYSPSTGCTFPMVLPKEYDQKEITITVDSDNMIVRITNEKGKQDLNAQIVKQEIYNKKKPCVVYGKKSVNNFLDNFENKKRKIDYVYFDYYQIKDNKISLFIGKQKYEYKFTDFFYLYKPDEDHICFVPNEEPHWYGNGKGCPDKASQIKDSSCCPRDTLTIDPDCHALIDKMADCSLPTIQNSVWKGPDDFFKILMNSKMTEGYTYMDFVFDHSNIDGYSQSPELFLALMNQESRGKVNAISPTGATGLMQLTTSTATELGELCYTLPGESEKCQRICTKDCKIDNRKNPILSILAGYETLKRKYATIKKCANGNERNQEELMKMTIAAYNAGEGVICKAITEANKAGTKISWNEVSYKLQPEMIPYFKNDFSKKRAKITEIRTHVDKVFGYKEYFAANILKIKGEKDEKS